MAEVKCPTCGNRFESDSSKSMPFCSKRCQQIDMNRWLNEENRLPVEDIAGDIAGDIDEYENGFDLDSDPSSNDN